MKNPDCSHPAKRGVAPLGGCFQLPSAVFALAAVLGVAAQPSALAQSTTIKSQPQRATVPDYGATVSVLTNYVSISSATETLSLFGLPSAASYGFSVGSGSASFGTLLSITSTSVPDGVYALDLNASGTVTDDLYLTLQSGRMWTGTTNVSTAWSSTASWIGGTPPGPANDVLLTQIGAQTNLAISGVFSPNSIVDQNFTVGSLRFSQTNSGTSYHIVNINPGVTLSLLGANGLSMLQDFTALGSGMNAIFSGTNGTLFVSNSLANITMLEDDSTTHTLDMSRLGAFVANVSRVAPGDYLLYPGVTNELAQGYSGSTAPFIYVNKFYPKLYLAHTNFITAKYVDPFNYSNSLARSYALEMVNNPVSATSSSAAPTLSLGVTNVFNLDSVCFAGFGGTTLAVGFNPALMIVTNVNPGVSTNYSTNKMVAVFRNTDGVSRMSAFCVGDLAGSYTNAQGNTKGNVNFGANNGYLDMLVDRFYLSRDRTNVFNSSGDDAQTTFGYAAGIINANTVTIGDQENGNQPYQNYVYGAMYVSNTAVLKVNSSIQLGYETAGSSDTSLPGVSYGILSVGPGGTVMANSVGIGGVTKNSGKVGNMGASSGSAALNTITLTNGATLVVSNTIGDSSAISYPTVTAGVVPGFLGTLNIANSELVLNVNGSNPGAYVFTSALNTSGSTSNYLVIASLKNINVPASGSISIPLIWVGLSGTPNAAAFTKVIVPSGYQGALLQDATNGQILDLVLSAHTPRNLKWVGNLSANWDTTTYNWLDLNTGLHTNFDNGDFTTFDDTSSAPTVSITSAVQLIPNNVTVSNNVNYYTFTGAGTLAGGSTITKNGVGSLEIDAQVSLGVQVNAGSVVGSGLTGGVTIASGGAWNYTGQVDGNVSCSGVGVNNGTINGNLAVSGIFTNNSALYGTFATASGGDLANAGMINYTSGTSSIGTNSVFVNDGSLSVDVISVNAGGAFIDLDGYDTLTSVSVAAGGTFVPGGPGISTTVLNSDGVGNFPGAALLAQGSTTVFNVNVNANPMNTVLTCDHLSFGGSATAQTENGATLQINNIGGTPFAVGQSFQLFNNVYINGSVPFNTGSSTNTFPVISPVSPGPGLTWDLSQLWVNGSIGVISANSGPTLTSSIGVDGTGTNVVSQFSWSSAYLGYRLESQINPVSVGLSTNWSGVPGSTTNTSMTLTNAIGTNCLFYRLTYP